MGPAPKTVNVAEISQYLNLYGSVVGTPGISKELKDRCNAKISMLLDLIEPVIEQVRHDNSLLTL